MENLYFKFKLKKKTETEGLVSTEVPASYSKNTTEFLQLRRFLGFFHLTAGETGFSVRLRIKTSTHLKLSVLHWEADAWESWCSVHRSAASSQAQNKKTKMNQVRWTQARARLYKSLRPKTVSLDWRRSQWRLEKPRWNSFLVFCWRFLFSGQLLLLKTNWED